MVERVAVVMGTSLRLVVEGSTQAQASAAAEAALEEVERYDRLLSTWSAQTPMARLNAAPVDVAVPVGRDLLQLLARAHAWRDSTGGAFDPTVGALIDAWDLRGRGRRPSPAELAAARRAVTTDALVLDRRAGTGRWRRKGTWIDTGAFGKGAALGAARRVLERAGVVRAFMDLGGQVLALAPGDEAPWTVDIAHPSHRQQPCVQLRLAGVSAATSGDSERWIEVNGQRLGHILDPRTGLPTTPWGSVTVVGTDPFVADVLSTALYVLGPDAGLAWARGRTDVGVLFLVANADGVEARWTPAMARWLDRDRYPHPSQGKADHVCGF